MPHIAVIGAGIAGLSCSTMLQEAGYTVSLFDKSSGPSGRMSTRCGNNWQCDHGAQYFIARHAEFRSEVARWQRAGVAGVWTPRVQVFGSRSFHEADSAPEWFVGIPRMTAPAYFLSAAMTLTTRTTVQQIRRETDGWHLFSVESGWLNTHFDAVLFTLPAPQVVPLLRQPAPALAALANKATMRGCWALMARFAAPLALPFDAAFVNQGPLRWVARDNSKPGRSGDETWVLHASAEWSETHLEQVADSVATTLLQAFGELGSPAAKAWMAHRWRYADTDPALNTGCVWQAASGLGLCGDWLNGGTVEGAWLSGRELAQSVLLSDFP